jgi:ribosomal protein S18 acetylase RimI-like enzyme
MKRDIIKDVTIRKLDKNEAIPYELLISADPSRLVIETYIGASEIYVALINAKVVGVFVLYRLSGDAYEIKNVAVEEQLQNKGIGKLLLSTAIQITLAKKVNLLVIGTSNASVGQLYLYQRAGFEIKGIKYNFFLDNYHEPIFENGIQCKHMIILEQKLC